MKKLNTLNINAPVSINTESFNAAKIEQAREILSDLVLEIADEWGVSVYEADCPSDAFLAYHTKQNTYAIYKNGDVKRISITTAKNGHKTYTGDEFIDVYSNTFTVLSDIETININNWSIFCNRVKDCLVDTDDADVLDNIATQIVIAIQDAEEAAA